LQLDLRLYEQVVDLSGDGETLGVLQRANGNGLRCDVELWLQRDGDGVSLEYQAVVLHGRYIRQVPDRTLLIDHQQDTIAGPRQRDAAILLERVRDGT